MARPGQQLRAMREQLGLSIRDVSSRSALLAQKYGKSSYSLPPNRLWEIETGGVVPTIYRLYSFSIIYGRSIEELLRLCGVDLEETRADCYLVASPRTNLTSWVTDSKDAGTPGNGDESCRTIHLGTTIERGVRMRFPDCDSPRFSYGYIGTEDITMSPLLTPGSMVQIDESSAKVEKGPWRSEFERPIYFVETRQGFRCCWCMVHDGHIVLQPHPLSAERVSMWKYPREAEVIGQVVAAVVRFSKQATQLPACNGRL
jgi:transcriptional regulator with XRE-family HTH domain